MTRPWYEAYVGLPFGEGPGEVTCWSLVCRVYADRLGVDLPSYGEISAHDLARVARMMAAAVDSGPDDGWTVPELPAAHDVVLMRAPGSARRIVHVGVMVDGAKLLHVEAASHAVIVPTGHWSVVGRINGWRRLA